MRVHKFNDQSTLMHIDIGKLTPETRRMHKLNLSPASDTYTLIQINIEIRSADYPFMNPFYFIFI